MKKNIWIINHYAGNTLFEKGGRHYWTAKFLKEKGYEPIVICSNAKHGSKADVFFEDDTPYTTQIAEAIGVPYLFIKSRPYSGNGKARIMNMVDFYKNVIRVSGTIAKTFGSPDIIYASSVHPLTLVAGLKIAKKFKVKCICEIRDLWPESLVAYGMLKKNSIAAKYLYHKEKCIYKKADKVIMTWPGGYQYIIDRGWQKDISEDKVVFVSNGIDLKEYKRNINLHPYHSDLFCRCNDLRFVYAGSIRKVNNLGVILQAAEILKNRGFDQYALFLFGDGDERTELERKAKEQSLDCVHFMGKIPKNEVPSMLSQADISILHNSSTSLDKYGQSQNKLFEYLASGCPILMTYSVGYSVVKKEICGIELDHQTPEAIADAIQQISVLPPNKINCYKENAKKCALKYDFEVLTDIIINTIEAL